MKTQWPLDYSQAVQAIHEAVEKGMTTHRKPYKNVAVLMFHWDNDDIGVAPLETELAQTFRHIFELTVEQYLILSRPPAGNPTQRLQNRLVAFRKKHQDPDNLLIYVYSGHAHSGASRSEYHL